MPEARMNTRYRVGQLVRVGMAFRMSWEPAGYEADPFTGCDFRVVGGTWPFYDIEELATGLEVNITSARLTALAQAQRQPAIVLP